MKATVVHSFDRPLQIEELPVPTPEAGEVLVRIETSGLCHMQLPIFETVLGGIELRGSIVGTRYDLEEVFELHRRGLTQVEYAERRLEDVNRAIEEVLDGTAPAPRLVFRMPSAELAAGNGHASSAIAVPAG